MRIVKFIIENYKALKGRNEFSPEGANFMLIGQNGAGKTSAGRALIDILTKNIPSKPVTAGEHEGYVEYKFDNGQKLLAKFSENGTNKLELISPEGLKINTPKELIAKLTGTGMAFDIDEFLSMQPKPRRELLEKIAGLDFTELNQEEKEAMERRRELNAAVKAAEARVKPYNNKLAEMDVVDTSDAVATLKEMTEANAAWQRVDAGLKQRAAKIADIDVQIESLKSTKEQLDLEIQKGKEWLKTNDEFTENQIEQQELLISQADEIREAKRLKRESADLDLLRAQAQAEDTMIRNIREEKELRIKSAKLPADGLSFDVETDELLLDGVPFHDNQIAASRKLIAAVQIAASMLGDIKYLHFDGAALDRASADMILKWADDNDLQLCLERPVWEGGDGVKMEIIEPMDGVAPKAKKESTKTIPSKIETTTKDEPVAKAVSDNNISSQQKSKMPWD
jgi:hypothetical protein